MTRNPSRDHWSFGPNSDQSTWYLADGSFHASDGSDGVDHITQ